MGIFRRFTKQKSKEHKPDDHYMVYVRCDRCGEPISARVNLRRDLSLRYSDAGEADEYFTRKSLIGSGLCFERIEVELSFDASKMLINRSIHGGTFLDEDEYHRLATT
jgi:hypothetical protein